MIEVIMAYSDNPLSDPSDEVMEWLSNNIGNGYYIGIENSNYDPLKYDWYYYFIKEGIRYYFESKEDALIFKLTWC